MVTKDKICYLPCLKLQIPYYHPLNQCSLPPCHCATTPPRHRVSQPFALPPATQTAQNIHLVICPCLPTTASPHHRVTTSLRHHVIAPPCNRVTASVSHLPCPLPPNHLVICLAPNHRVTASPCHCATVSPHQSAICLAHHSATASPRQSAICLAPCHQTI